MLYKILVGLILGSLTLGLFIQYQTRAPQRNFSDYRVYHNAGKNILLGKNIYVREAQEITPFKYSPVFAVFMAPFAVFDKRVSASLFFLLNLVCLFFIFRLSRKLIFFQEVGFKKEYMIFFIVFVLSFRAILNCLQSGQVGLLILFLILSGLFFISRGHDTSGSFLIGFAVMIKYMPFLLVLYFFLKKKYRIVFLIMLSLLIYCLLPAIFVGINTNFNYLKEWFPYITSTSLDPGSFMDLKNHSLWAFSRKFFSFTNNSLASLAAISAFFIAVLLFSFGKKKKYLDCKLNIFYDCIDYGVIFLCMALFNPNAWLHNFTIIIFPYMVAVYYLFIHNFKDKVVLLLVIFSFILSSLVSESVVGEKMQCIFEYYFTVTWGAVLLFIALVKIKFYSNFKINAGGPRSG